MARMSAAPHHCRILLSAMGLGFLPSGIPAQCPRGGSAHAPIRWPGFAAAVQNGRYVVVFVDAARRTQLPPAGARLVGCDGESADQLARERRERAARANAAPLLWDTGSAAAAQPAACTFETTAGRVAYRMEYTPASPAVIAAAIAAAAGESRPLPYPRLF